MALMLGAKHVTTIDYVNLSSEDPRITVLHATEFNAKFLRNELPEFDAIISYSSLEHSGLGRYVFLAQMYSGAIYKLCYALLTIF